MIAIMLPSIFTIEIGDTPTLVFEAQNLREAHELCHEQWLKGDLSAPVEAGSGSAGKMANGEGRFPQQCLTGSPQFVRLARWTGHNGLG
jgi:hypothetical protein